MKASAVVDQWKVKVSIREEPVVVLAIDQVVGFLALFVFGRIKQISDSVRLFTDVVAVGFSQLP